MTVYFKLYNDTGSLIDTVGPLTLNSQTDLPLDYLIPALSTGAYTLNMLTGDVLDNVGTTEVGTFEVGDTSSFFAADFHTSDFSFDSDSYFTDVLKEFNTTKASTDLVLMSSMNVKKLTGDGLNEVWVRVKVDGSEVLEEKLRTVEDIGDEGSTGMKPIAFSLGPGRHNLSLAFKKTGEGSVEVSDMDLVFGELLTTSGYGVHGQLIDNSFIHYSSEFASSFEWSVEKTVRSPTFMVVKQTVDATEPGMIDYYFQNLAENDTSSYWSRYLSDPTDTGSISGNHIDTSRAGGDYAVMSRSYAGTVSSDFALLYFDLRDAGSHLINGFRASNELTNLSSSRDYSMGVHNLVNKTVNVYNGSGYFLAMKSSLSSLSGEQTSRYFINSSQLPESNCYSKKERHLNSELDVGNVFMYFVCDGLVPGNAYTFNLWLEVSGNETIRQFDESLSGFEVTEFNASSINLPPIHAGIISPSPGSSRAGLMNLSWFAFTDPDGDAVTYNVSLLNLDGSVNQTLTQTTSLSHIFDSSTVADGPWILQVTGCDELGLCSTNLVNFTVDNTPPSVTNLSSDAPAVSNGSSQDVVVEFTSSEFPVNVSFSLYDASGHLVDSLDYVAVDEAADLPLNYVMPSLGDGNYTLEMDVVDAAGNVDTSFVGSFEVIDTTAPSITVVSSDLPSTTDGSSRDVSTEFTSTEFPLTVIFELYDKTGSLVDSQAPSSVADESSLPVNYVMPALGEGTYILNMTVTDAAGNNATVTVGEFTVESVPESTSTVSTSTTSTLAPTTTIRRRRPKTTTTSSTTSTTTSLVTSTMNTSTTLTTTSLDSSTPTTLDLSASTTTLVYPHTSTTLSGRTHPSPASTTLAVRIPETLSYSALQLDDVPKFLHRCFNSVRDDSESGTDCGGDCMPCTGCVNGVRDIGEEDVDCGGTCMACDEAAIAQVFEVRAPKTVSAGELFEFCTLTGGEPVSALVTVISGNKIVQVHYPGDGGCTLIDAGPFDEFIISATKKGHKPYVMLVQPRQKPSPLNLYYFLTPLALTLLFLLFRRTKVVVSGSVLKDLSSEEAKKYKKLYALKTSFNGLPNSRKKIVNLNELDKKQADEASTLMKQYSIRLDDAQALVLAAKLRAKEVILSEQAATAVGGKYMGIKCRSIK